MTVRGPFSNARVTCRIAELLLGHSFGLRCACLNRITNHCYDYGHSSTRGETIGRWFMAARKQKLSLLMVPALMADAVKSEHPGCEGPALRLEWFCHCGLLGGQQRWWCRSLRWLPVAPGGGSEWFGAESRTPRKRVLKWSAGTPLGTHESKQ